ncbi:MAG: hypothetical protein FWG25_10730 [Promicromonosporaceae bacterium]|nr:hypothetical protein [Promicromonosporaceae bacterium]
MGELDESDGFAGGTMATGPNGFGVRWWNVRHPIKYAELIAQNRFPIEGQERLTADQAQLERVMLALRLADGLPVEALESTQRHAEPIDFIPPQAVLSYPVFSESSSDPLRAFSASNSSQPQPQPSSAVVSAASASSSSSSKNPQREIAQLIADGLIEGRAAIADRVIVLTRKGRLLADTVTRRLT